MLLPLSRWLQKITFSTKEDTEKEPPAPTELQGLLAPEKPHPALKWHEATEEWYCVKCGRTSDNIREEDAWAELAYFDCVPPPP
jgi:hypothetical protein